MTYIGIVSLGEFTEMPEIVRGCKVCQPTDEEMLSGNVVISPAGIAHHGGNDGETDCGKDATPDGWWWPL